jgi:hypothetical protein
MSGCGVVNAQTVANAISAAPAHRNGVRNRPRRGVNGSGIRWGQERLEQRVTAINASVEHTDSGRVWQRTYNPPKQLVNPLCLLGCRRLEEEACAFLRTSQFSDVV